jgi:hypothetical protein
VREKETVAAWTDPVGGAERMRKGSEKEKKVKK